MELDILFLNVLKYKDKETGQPKYRFSYILNDDNARKNSEQLKGLSELCFYTSCSKPFDTLTGDDALTPMKLVVEQKPSVSNPLKLVSTVTQVVTKNEVISLL